MRILHLALLPAVGVSLAMAGGGRPVVNQARDRGRTTVQGVTMPLAEQQRAMLATTREFTGMLIDAGCKDRSFYNLSLPPESLSTAIAPAAGANKNAPGGESAFGISVSPQTLQQERADIMPHQVPDMVTRQMDPTCAINAQTTGFALLLSSGRLLNLDAGGNTYVWQAVQGTQQGRAMLNGKGPGLKPWARVRGYIDGSTLVIPKPAVEVAANAPAPRGSATRRR